MFWWPSLRKHNIFSPECGPCLCVHDGNYYSRGITLMTLFFWGVDAYLWYR